MANSQNALSGGKPLSNGLMPPAPDLGAQQPAMGAPALSGGGAAPQQQQGAPQGPQAAPAPTHDQTVAALRHFNAVIGELRGLLQNPDLGKADLKSKIIDGAVKLVEDRIIPPNAAVTQLATVPERPFDQRGWVQQHYAQTVQAAASVLDHHRQAALGTGNYDLENKLHDDVAGPDDHLQTMQGLVQQHYGGQS